MEKYLKNTYKNIEGITVYDSKIPGKNIGIFAITHGNEKVGLEVFKYLENIFNIGKNLKKGKIFFIAVNLKAYYENKRFIDENMNRISKNNLKNNSYESKRFYELKEIFDEIDVAFDLHSVSIGDEKMLIIDKKTKNLANNIFDGEYFLMDDIGNSGAMIGYFFRNNKLGFGIECGNHNSKDAFKTGVKNVLNLLKYYKNINGEIEKTYKNNIFLNFYKEIFALGENFLFSKNYNSFTKLNPEEIYAEDNENIYKNENKNSIYIGLLSQKIEKNDGCGFLFLEEKN